MGVRLRIDTTYLDLDADASLQFIIQNPLFDPDGAEALFSFPFRLPATARNLFALSNANRLDNADNTTYITGAALEIEGAPFEPTGVIDLDEQAFSEDYVNIVFRNGTKSLFDELEKVKLTEILETVSSLDTAPVARWTFAVVNTPPVTVAFTIDGATFTQGFTFGTFPADYAALAASINGTFTGLATATASNLYLDSVMLETHPLESFSQIDLISKVTPGERVYTGFINHVDTVNQTPIASHCFPTIFWQNFYKELHPAVFQGWVNPWVDGETIDNEATIAQTWAATYVPFVYVTYILDRIVAALPSDVLESWDGWLVDDADGSSLIVFNNKALDRLEENYYEVGVRYWLNRFVEEIDLNNHVPDMTAKDFLQSLLEGLALYLKQVGTSFTFVKKRTMLASAPVDWTALALKGAVATRKRRRGFKLQFPDLREDQVLIDASIAELEPQAFGEAWNTFTLPFHSCKHRSDDLPANNLNGKTPWVNQPGSSDEGGLGSNPYSFRLLLFRGLQVNEDSLPYPMASHDNLDYDDNPTGGLSLDLQASDGLYHLHHKGIPQLLADGQPVTIAVALGIEDLITLRQWGNARRSFSLPEGQVVGVVKSVKFSVSVRTGLGPCLVELVQER